MDDSRSRECANRDLSRIGKLTTLLWSYNLLGSLENGVFQQNRPTPGSRNPELPA